MNLSVIILNYNTKNLLQKCLESVYLSRTNFQFEVLVSDNGSADGSVEMVRQDFPQAILIENNANLGFSAGNNVAIKRATGRNILLLNSDTTVQTDTIDGTIGYLESHPDVGVVGCKVLLPSGELHQASRRKFPDPANAFLRLFGLRKFSDYNYRNVPVDREMEVDSVVGAFLMIRRSVIDQIGLLDEDFFMYGEDLDWCWRVKEAGFKVVYYPAVQITHYLYGSSKNIAFKTIRRAHDAMKIFYRKHYSEKHNWFFNQLVYFGINIRMYLVLMVNLFRNKKTVH
ncbi:MAG: glycosyltransferase family 2 protein [Candidatus Doudnabacteria bacterium]